VYEEPAKIAKKC